jgi:hypothetical protein
VHTLAALEPDPVTSMRDVELLLEQVGAGLATTYLAPNPTGGPIAARM